MKFRSFLKLTEIQTKVASMIPFLLGSLYAFYRFQTFNWINAVLMLFSLLLVDMATTTINNYVDYRKANKKYGFGYESHNAIVRDKIKESIVIATIACLLSAAVILGLLLFFRTNLVVLLLGAASFIVGIFYSFGPVPISRTPFGEIFSGLFMGFLIPLIAVLIHVPDSSLLALTITDWQLSLQADLTEIVWLFFISCPAIVGIANIMLANNICDIEDDLENNRYTLPIYIGQKTSLIVFRVLYIIAYLSVLVLIISRVLPLLSSLVFVTVIPVHRQVTVFMQTQNKESTFVFAVKNFVLINLALVLTIGLGLVIQF